MIQISEQDEKFFESKLPQNNSFEKIEISTIITQKTYNLFINIHKQNDAYIDDIQLTIQ